MPTHVFRGPVETTVTTRGGGSGGGASSLLAAPAAVVSAAVAVVSAAAFVIANQEVLALGTAGIGAVLTASTWLLHRYATVRYFNPAAIGQARCRVQMEQAQPAATVVHLHRHVIEYAPAPAIEPGGRQIVAAAVLAAARETEEVPR